MSQDALLVEREGQVVTLTMNRPEVRNALSPEMLVRMADAWEMVDGDDDIRVVILTGAAGHFCAGADLDKLVGRSLAGAAPEDEWEVRIREDFNVIFKGLLRNYRLKTPLIAAVEGSCIAGGTEIIQATDIRIAGRSAKFGVSEVRWSLFPTGGSTVRLRRQIPFTRAMELLLTGDHYSATEAKEMGLIGRVVDDGQALSTAHEVADRIASNGPIAVREIKASVLATEFEPEAKAMDIEFEHAMRVFGTDDSREGPRAFKEKRKPVYKGR